MGETYIDAQVARVNRNLLLVNGGILGMILLFFAFMILGALALVRFQQQNLANLAAQNPGAIYSQPAALDTDHPTPISVADLASPQRLGQLEGHAVTLSDPQAQNLMFPVWDWMTRSTGKTKPHAPPLYHVSLANGRPFLILPANPDSRTTFTGVIRPLTPADYNPVKPVLMGHGLQEPQPYLLDCLNLAGSPAAPSRPAPVAHPIGLGLPSPTTLLVFALTIGLTGWNVVKALQRRKNPLTHPIYAKLARYGLPLDLVRSIDAERQAGVTRISPVEFTHSWLLFPSFWTLDALPLDQIAWAYKMVTFYNFIPTFFRLIVVDRQGKSHPISTNDTQGNPLLAYIGQVRPWVFLGYNRQLRDRFWSDRDAVLAEIDARRPRNVP